MTTGPPVERPDPGLREAKKAATRDALSLAALRLALEHGLDAVRGEDVAAAAGVSPRTFRNYFASKYEAIVSRHADRAEQTARILAARPAGEPLWTAVHAALAETYRPLDTAPDAGTLAALRLMLAEPDLQAELLKAARAADDRLREAVAARTGTDPDRDVYPRLVAAVVDAANRTAVELYLASDPPRPLGPLLDEILGAVAAGLPEPPTSHTPPETP